MLRMPRFHDRPRLGSRLQPMFPKDRATLGGLSPEDFEAKVGTSRFWVCGILLGATGFPTPAIGKMCLRCLRNEGSGVLGFGQGQLYIRHVFDH